MVRYPHKLKFNIVGSESEPYQDDNGDWVVPENTTTEVELSCRAEPNGQGKMIAGVDGNNLVYAWTIYLAKDAMKLEYGQAVQVYNGTELLASGSCIMFSRGQMNSRLWV